VSIGEGSREVNLPHETGVSLTTRDHESDHKRVSMADLMTEANYLNPTLEVIAEVNTAASFETFPWRLTTISCYHRGPGRERTDGCRM